MYFSAVGQQPTDFYFALVSEYLVNATLFFIINKIVNQFIKITIINRHQKGLIFMNNFVIGSSFFCEMLLLFMPILLCFIELSDKKLEQSNQFISFSFTKMMKIMPTNQPNPTIYRRIKNYLYSPSHLLGAGNFSKVYSGRNETTGETVALKVVQLQSLKLIKLQELHRSQLEVLMKINHPNVLKCYEIFNDEKQCYIITQVCNGGDLDMFVKKEGVLSEEKAAHFIKDIFQGLLYLADNHIVHRDIKVANIFINNGSAKIADFGFAVFARQKFRDLNIGSPLYMSPEGFIDCVYGPKTDVWAFGILIFQLLHGDTPYSSCKLQNDLKYNLSIPFDRSKVKSSISSDLKEVIYRCLEIDQSKRISMQQLKDTAFFRRLYNGTNLVLGHKLQEIKHPIYLSGQLTHSNEGFKELNNHFEDKPKQIHHLKNNKSIHSTEISCSNPSRPKNLLEPPSRQVIRLGRPISTDRQVLKLNPPTQERLRLKSIDSKKPTQKYIILTSLINFKAAVNLLHYCRGLFKCIQSMIAIKQGQNQIKYLTGWLILVLQELNRKLNQNQVNFEGQNKEIKSKKLRQVRNQYQRKYTNQLKSYISNFINKPSLEDIKLFFFLQYRKYDIALQLQQAAAAYLQLVHFVVLMYDSTRLLKKCQEEGNFTIFINYKDVENMLSWTKDKFNANSYLGFKKRMIVNS